MSKKMTEFEVFEKEVVEKLLAGDYDKLKILRKQYEKAKIKSREFSGTGFFTSFVIPDYAPRLNHSKSFHLGDVIGEIDGVKNGVGFLLFVKEGAINFLEGYTYGDEKWPENIINYKITYILEEKRKLEKIKEILE